MPDIQLTEKPHPFDPDAFELYWDHDNHNHYIVVPREYLAGDRSWVARHALRVNSSCAAMFTSAGGDGRG